MKFEHDTVLQEYGVDRKPDIRQLHKLPGIHKEPNLFRRQSADGYTNLETNHFFRLMTTG